jgi:3-hydroxyacyl-[acyl-carrier-protein] dehydratase
MDREDGEPTKRGNGRMSRKAPVNEVPSEIDITEILARIPHRYPFLLVDRAEEYKPSQSIVGVKCVTFNEPFFQGHFPEYPVMPGVLIVEALAQTGAVLMSKSLDVDVAGKTILFMSLDNCRFRHPVRPGDVIRMPVEVLRARGDVFKFRGKAMVGDKVAAEAEFAAMVVATQ